MNIVFEMLATPELALTSLPFSSYWLALMQRQNGP
jgi:hypothetical protein